MSQQLTPLWSPLCGVFGSFCVVDQLLSWSDRHGWLLAQLVARPCLVQSLLGTCWWGHVMRLLAAEPWRILYYCLLTNGQSWVLR